jgi:hypothetical protein
VASGARLDFPIHWREKKLLWQDFVVLFVDSQFSGGFLQAYFATPILQTICLGHVRSHAFEHV